MMATLTTKRVLLQKVSALNSLTNNSAIFTQTRHFVVSQEDPEEEVPKKKKIKKGKHNDNAGSKRLRKEATVKRFIDDEASQDDDDSDGENLAKREDAYYDAKLLERRNKQLDLDEMGQRYEQVVGGDEDGDAASYGSQDEHMMHEDVIVQSKLPSTRDPKLWQVRVKKNFEKIAVMALLNKSIDFARRGTPLSILSVTSSDSTEGYIFVEAFKEIHVKEACANLHFVFNSMILLPTEQMTSVYQNDKAKNNDFRKHQWVRIKTGGAYSGDIGLFEGAQDSKAWVRLIPRIEPVGAGADKKKKAFFRRVPQMVNLKPQQFDTAEKQKSKHSMTNKHMWSVRGQLVYHGFVYKSFSVKQIDSGPNVKPSYEEL